jgi:hypothetical protein
MSQPLTEAQIVDLRRRVLAGEDVSDEELLAGIDAISAHKNQTKEAKADSVVVKKIDLASKFAAFKQKNAGEVPSP